MDQRPQGVLFLCTGNSARSILAEAILARLGAGRFAAYSAGSQPAGQVNPAALELLRSLEHPTGQLRSKSWDAFTGPEAPRLDLVITLCDSAAGEACPLWPGQPVIAHWGLPDPAGAPDEAAKRAAFLDCYRVLSRRIERLTRLPLGALEGPGLRSELARIGQLDGAPAEPRP